MKQVTFLCTLMVIHGVYIFANAKKFAKAAGNIAQALPQPLPGKSPPASPKLSGAGANVGNATGSEDMPLSMDTMELELGTYRHDAGSK